MRLTNYRTLTLTLAGMLLCGTAFAQQSSAPSTNPPASSTATPAKPKTQGTTAAKPGTTAAKKTPAPLVLKTQKDKESYAIGMGIGKNLSEQFKKDNVQVDQAILLRAMKDALAGEKLVMTDEEAKAALVALTEDVRKHQQEVLEADSAKNSKAGDEYMAANKAKPGVVTLPSGLQYKVITQGNGPKPTAEDVVVCNYKGALIDGTEFDSSYKRGKPMTIPVGRVIKGWTEALQLMPVGSKWELVIPPSLGYGPTGTNGGPIGPNATLVFEVELLSIQPKQEAKPASPAPAPNAQSQPEAKPEAGATPSSPQPKTDAQPAPSAVPATQPKPQPEVQPQAKPR